MKKLIVIFPLLIFLLSVCFFAADVAQTEADGLFSGGDGSQLSPYIIATANDLYTLSTLINDDKTNSSYTSKHYLQTSNITLSTPFNPIGKIAGGACSFRGIYDGGGFTISNIQVSVNTSAGLFGYCLGATIKNVGIASGSIIGADETGGIAGRINETTVVTNCFNNAHISGTAGYVGGIVGYNRGKVTYSYNSGNITLLSENSSNAHAAGGVVGCNTGVSGYSAGIVSNVYSKGTVTANKSNAGGIVGLNAASEANDPGTVDNAFYNANGAARAVGINSTNNAFPFYLKSLNTSEMVTLPEDLDNRPDGFVSNSGEYIFDTAYWVFNAPVFVGGKIYDCFYPQLKIFDGKAQAVSTRMNTVPYTVTFDRQDGRVNTEKVYEGEKVKANGYIKPSSREGYTFSHWFFVNESKVSEVFDPDTEITADITLYAEWTFNKLTASVSAKNNVFTAEYGTTITLTAVVNHGIKPYIKWYKRVGAGAVLVDEGHPCYSIDLSKISDSGEYFCTVSVTDGVNGDFVETSAVQISITKLNVPISISADYTEIVYGKDKKVTVTATVGVELKSSFGMPLIKWFVEGKEIAVAQGTSFTNIIKNVADSGRYYCKISFPGNEENINSSTSNILRITINGADPVVPHYETEYTVSYKTGLTLATSGIILASGFKFETPDMQISAIGEYQVNLVYDPKNDPNFIGDPSNYNTALVSVTIYVEKGNYSAEDIPSHQVIRAAFFEGIVLGDLRLDDGFRLDASKNSPDMPLQANKYVECTLYAIYNGDPSNYNDYSPVLLTYIVEEAKIVITVGFYFDDIIYTDMSISDLSEYLFISSPNPPLGTLFFKPNQQLTAGANNCKWSFQPDDSNYDTVDGIVVVTAVVRIVSEGIFALCYEDGKDVTEKTLTYYAFSQFDLNSILVYEKFNVIDPVLISFGAEGYSIEYPSGLNHFTVSGNEAVQDFKVLYKEYVVIIKVVVKRIEYDGNTEFNGHMNFANSGALTAVYSNTLTKQGIFQTVDNMFKIEFGICYLSKLTSSVEIINAGEMRITAYYSNGDNNYNEKEVLIIFVITKAAYQNISHQSMTLTYFVGICLNDISLNEFFRWADGNTKIYVFNEAVIGYNALYNAEPLNYQDYSLTISIKVLRASYQISFESDYSFEYEYDSEEKEFKLNSEGLPQSLTIQYIGILTIADVGATTFIARFVNSDVNFTTPADISITIKITPRRIEVDFDELLKNGKNELNEGFTAEVKIKEGSLLFHEEVIMFSVANLQDGLEVLSGADILSLTGLKAGYYEVTAQITNANYILVGNAARGFMIKQIAVDASDGSVSVHFEEDGVKPEARLVVTELSDKIINVNKIIKTDSYKIDNVYSIALFDGINAFSYNGKIKVSVMLKEDYLSLTGLKILIVGNDNTVKYVDAEIVDGYIVFEATQFVSYAVAYQYEWPAPPVSLVYIILILGAAMIILFYTAILLIKSVGKR